MQVLIRSGRMSFALSTVTLDRGLASPDQRLWVSLGASLLTHAAALAVFAGLLLPAPTSVSIQLGEPPIMNVRLSKPAPQDAVIEPPPMADVASVRAEMEPALMVDAAPTHAAIEPVITRLRAPKPLEAPSEPVVPTRHIDLRVPAARAAGAATLADSSTEAVSDAPLPPVDITVRMIEDPESLGHAQALRLAQRFPQSIARPARLQAPLVVFYPPEAARAHREARVSATLVIDADGSALEATLVPDEPLFAASIENALRNAKYKAAEDSSKPTAHWLILEFVFSVRSSAVSAVR